MVTFNPLALGGRSLSKRKEQFYLLLKNGIFAGYLAFLSYGLFFAESMGRTAERTVASYNLAPFTEIRRYISYVNTIGLPIVLLNLLGNVAAFVPFGFLLPAMWPKGEKHHPVAATVVTMIFSVIVEILQYVTRSGIADVDDVIMNTFGGFLGYLLYRVFEILQKK